MAQYPTTEQIDALKSQYEGLFTAEAHKLKIIALTLNRLDLIANSNHPSAITCSERHKYIIRIDHSRGLDSAYHRCMLAIAELEEFGQLLPLSTLDLFFLTYY